MVAARCRTYFLGFFAFFFVAVDFVDAFGVDDFTFALTFDFVFVLVAAGAAFAVDVTLADFFLPLAGFFASGFLSSVVFAFLADLPNAESHPLEYASFVPTRRIVIDLLGVNWGMG